MFRCMIVALCCAGLNAGAFAQRSAVDAIPNGLTSDEGVVEFAQWLDHQDLAEFGAFVDSSDLLGQLYIARQKARGVGRSALDRLRDRLSAGGMRAASLEPLAVEQAARAWLSAAADAAPRSQRRMVEVVAAEFGIALDAPPPRDVPADELRDAQLRVARMRGDAGVPPDMVDRAIERYVRDGYVAASFEPDAIQAAAIEATIERVQKFPTAAWPGLIAEAVRAYGIDRAALSQRLNSTPTGFGATLRQFATAESPEARQVFRAQLESMPIDASAAAAIAREIDLASDPAVRAGLVQLLAADSSPVGRDCLVRQLAAAEDEGARQVALDALLNRREFIPQSVMAVLAATEDEDTLGRAFKLAEVGALYDQPDALELLRRELSGPTPQRRVLAVQAIASTLRSDVVGDVVGAIEREPEAVARAQMIGVLGGLTEQPAVQTLLCDRIASDPDVSVRVAAVHAFPLVASPSDGDSPVSQEREARLRSALAASATPPEVLAAMQARLDALALQRASLDDRRQNGVLSAVRSALQQARSDLAAGKELTESAQRDLEAMLSEAERLAAELPPERESDRQSLARLIQQIRDLSPRRGGHAP